MSGNEEEDQTTLGDLKKLLLGLDKKFDSVKITCNKMVQVTNKHTREIDTLMNKNNELERDRDQLREEVQQLKREVNFSRKRQRANNVILHNVEDSEVINKSLLNHVMNIIKITGVPGNNIDFIKRIGRDDKKGKRPVLITLVLERDKKLFYTNSAQIKEEFNVIVADDSTKEEREEYRKLKQVKNKLSVKNIEAKIFGNKVVIGKKRYNIEEAQKIAELESIKSPTTTVRKREASNSPHGSNRQTKIRKQHQKNAHKKKEGETPVVADMDIIEPIRSDLEEEQ